jgi:hypothetical protein
MSSLESLKSSLRTASDPTAALAAYLKASVPVASGELFKEKPFERKCGEGVSASECKGIIDQCLAGDSTTCKQLLADIVNNPNRANVLADGIKGMDGRMARQVCKTLGIDYNLPHAVNTWIGDLMSKDSAAGLAIKNNTPLMDIIQSFAVAAANPELNSKSLAFSRAKAAMSVLPIMPRIPRNYQPQSGGGFLTGGGRNIKLVANTYEQYTDSLKRLASMSGGGAELNKTHDEIANIYNSFVFSLQARGKQIDKNDNERIRHEIDKLRLIEEKLSKVVTYIARYNALLNSEDKEVRGLVASGVITEDLLEQLNVKYEELKKKHEKKSYGIMSITDAINKVLSAANKMENNLEAIKECLGPHCEEVKAKKLAHEAELAAADAYRYDPSKFSRGPDASRGAPRAAAAAAATVATTGTDGDAFDY